MTLRIGVVGFGEAGSAFATGLADDGHEVVAYDPRARGPEGEALRRLSEFSGVDLVEGLADVAARAEVVLSLVTPSAAYDVASALAAHLTAAHIVADLNSTSPGMARRIGEVVSKAGAEFADVAVMSAVPSLRHRVPLLASGPGATRFAALEAGMRVEVVGDAAGVASAVKMLRSLIVKGLEALLLEFTIAAEHFGAADRVLASLNDDLPTDDWGKLTSYLLTRTAQHADRRGRELQQVADMLRELDIEPTMATAGSQRLLWAADRGLAGRFNHNPPRHYEEVVEALLQGHA